MQDAEALVAYLRRTYARRKVFVMAHSWGARIGLDLARRRPEWLYAYIGVGQMIDAHAAERENYAWALAVHAGDAAPDG